MSSGMTDYTGPRDIPPSPRRRSRFVDALCIATALIALVALSLAVYADHRQPPATPIVTVYPVTRVVTVVVTHDVDHYWTVPPIEVTRETTRTITVPVTVEVTVLTTPAPPQNGKG